MSVSDRMFWFGTSTRDRPHNAADSAIRNHYRERFRRIAEFYRLSGWTPPIRRGRRSRATQALIARWCT